MLEGLMICTTIQDPHEVNLRNGFFFINFKQVQLSFVNNDRC